MAAKFTEKQKQQLKDPKFALSLRATRPLQAAKPKQNPIKRTAKQVRRK
jgi:hypothetical protein